MIPLLALAAVVAVDTPAFPHFSDIKPEDNITATPLSLTVVDAGSLPGAFPGMEQSLSIYEDFAVGGNEIFRRAFSTIPNYWVRVGIGQTATYAMNIATDAFFLLPFGAPHSGWMHEEWHRAVMSSHGIDSFDTLGIPDSQLKAALGDRFYGGSSGSVIGESDAQLAAFKATSPGDYVRMSTAGIESQLEANRRIERDQFFFAGDDVWLGPIVIPRAWNAGTLWLNAISTAWYMGECGSQDSVAFTAHDESIDTKNPLARDFTGLDCDASVYDMFRPNEPYAARGKHPSGVGVDRFRDLSDFTPAEKQYASDSALRALFVFADPALLNIGGVRFDDVAFGKPLKVTARLSHMLSPIGSGVELESLAQLRPFNVAAVVRATAMPTGISPAVDLSLVRFPLVMRLPAQLDASTRALLSFVDPTVVTVSLDGQAWIQPHQLIATRNADQRLGGLTRVDVGVEPIPSLEVIVTALVKSEGFAPGVLATGATGGLGLTVKTWIF